MATPALAALSRNFENPTVLAPAHIQELLREDSSGLRYLAPGPRNSALAEAKRLRAESFDVAFLINRSFRSALTAWLARIPARVGHATEHRAFLLTHKIPFDSTRFEAANYSDLLEAFGLTVNFGRVRLTVTEAEKQRGRDLLQGSEIGIQPGASFAAKTLPADKLTEVARRLQGAGYRLALIGGKGEERFGEELHLREPAVNLIGACSLRESMGVVAGLKACVGGSTGIMHIAAAVGCPTVTVFGPTLSSKWGHLYTPHETIQILSGNIEDMDANIVFEATMRAINANRELRQI